METEIFGLTTDFGDLNRAEFYVTLQPNFTDRV